MSNIKENSGVLIQGHIKIFDPESNKIYVNKRNAIHYENMSVALAESIANQGQGFINSMAFGNLSTPASIISNTASYCLLTADFEKFELTKYL